MLGHCPCRRVQGDDLRRCGDPLLWQRCRGSWLSWDHAPGTLGPGPGSPWEGLSGPQEFGAPLWLLCMAKAEGSWQLILGRLLSSLHQGEACSCPRAQLLCASRLAGQGTQALPSLLQARPSQGHTGKPPAPDGQSRRSGGTWLGWDWAVLGCLGSGPRCSRAFPPTRPCPASGGGLNRAHGSMDSSIWPGALLSHGAFPGLWGVWICLPSWYLQWRESWSPCRGAPCSPPRAPSVLWSLDCARPGLTRHCILEGHMLAPGAGALGGGSSWHPQGSSLCFSPT